MAKSLWAAHLCPYHRDCPFPRCCEPHGYSSALQSGWSVKSRCFSRLWEWENEVCIVCCIVCSQQPLGLWMVTDVLEGLPGWWRKHAREGCSLAKSLPLQTTNPPVYQPASYTSACGALMGHFPRSLLPHDISTQVQGLNFTRKKIGDTFKQ